MKTKLKIAGFLMGAAAIGSIGQASAAPVAYDGHYYEYVAFAGGSGSWDQAFALANASSFDGMQGYLATVTSAGENAFLSSLSTSVAYLGGSDANAPGVWTWADGPDAGQVFYVGENAAGVTPPGAYSAWGDGKPDNYGGGEYWLQTNFGGAGAWNDTWIGGTSGDLPTSGFFVEYGGQAAVPEPASWALMAVGFLGLGSAVRKSKRARVAIA